MQCLSLFQDTAGQERYHALGPIYYRDSQGAIIVYDITDEDSFHKVRLTNFLPSLHSSLYPSLLPSLPPSLPSLTHFLCISFLPLFFRPSAPPCFLPSLRSSLPSSIYPSLLPSLPLPPPSKQARNWIKELRRMLGDKVTLCIVGNKIDLDKKRTVVERDALE